MACEACSIKFTLFKRKKQCMDCLRYFCTECVIRRFDRILSCDNCSMLSRRPLIRSQILQMRSKYLRQYLVAKKVSVKGCIEKEDLVNLLIIYANGHSNNSERINRLSNVPQNQTTENRAESIPRHPLSDGRTIPIVRDRTNENIVDSSVQHQIHENIENPQEGSQSRLESTSQVEERQRESMEIEPNSVERSHVSENSPTRRSRSPQISERPVAEVTTPEEAQVSSAHRVAHNLEIEEISESDANLNDGPEPVITEQEEAAEAPLIEHTEMFTEIQTWTGSVKLADIKELTELEYLTVKQLKDLLSANRVDYKGCVERCELLDRACRLWEDYRKARSVIETADEDALCKICLDAPIECVILECGHMACCIQCGKQMSECPICRQYVVRVVRFFKA